VALMILPFAILYVLIKILPPWQEEHRVVAEVHGDD
jgi:hypothetical protein